IQNIQKTLAGCCFQHVLFFMLAHSNGSVCLVFGSQYCEHSKELVSKFLYDMDYWHRSVEQVHTQFSFILATCEGTTYQLQTVANETDIPILISTKVCNVSLF